MWVEKANAIYDLESGKPVKLTLKCSSLKYLYVHLWNINAASGKHTGKHPGAGHPQTSLETCLLTKHSFHHWKCPMCLRAHCGLVQPGSVSWSIYPLQSQPNTPPSPRPAAPPIFTPGGYQPSASREATRTEPLHGNGMGSWLWLLGFKGILRDVHPSKAPLCPLLGPVLPKGFWETQQMPWNWAELRALNSLDERKVKKSSLWAGWSPGCPGLTECGPV